MSYDRTRLLSCLGLFAFLASAARSPFGSQFPAMDKHGRPNRGRPGATGQKIFCVLHAGTYVLTDINMPVRSTFQTRSQKYPSHIEGYFTSNTHAVNQAANLK